MVRAARTGALDYKNIGRSSKMSLYKETLVLLDIEAELTAEYMYNKAMYTEAPGEAIDMAFLKQLPWIGKAVTPAKGKVETLIDEYYKLTGKAKPKDG